LVLNRVQLIRVRLVLVNLNPVNDTYNGPFPRFEWSLECSLVLRVPSIWMFPRFEWSLILRGPSICMALHKVHRELIDPGNGCPWESDSPGNQVPQGIRGLG